MREAIWRFQDYMGKKANRIEHVCLFCSLFTPFKTTRFLQRTNQFFENSIQSNLFIEAKLDCCGQDGDNYNFCIACFSSILKSIPPKFECKNGINTTCCQVFLKKLEDLTFVEETVIAWAHLVISILKLRPVDVNTNITYQCICDHAVVLPQNSGPLLNSLLFASLVLYNVIQIV